MCVARGSGNVTIGAMAEGVNGRFAHVLIVLLPCADDSVTSMAATHAALLSGGAKYSAMFQGMPRCTVMPAPMVRAMLLQRLWQTILQPDNATASAHWLALTVLPMAEAD